MLGVTLPQAGLPVLHFVCESSQPPDTPLQPVANLWRVQLAIRLVFRGDLLSFESNSGIGERAGYQAAVAL